MQINLSRPLETVKEEQYDKLKNQLYLHITIENEFPEWKQANFNLAYTQLSLAKTTRQLSTGEQAQLDHIENVITWKEELLAERDRIKNLINTASTVKQVKDAVAGAVFEDYLV